MSHKTSERIYRYYTDSSNWEAVEVETIGKDLKVTWRAAGTGSNRRPVCVVKENKVLVYGQARQYFACEANSCAFVRGMAGKAVEFAKSE